MAATEPRLHRWNVDQYYRMAEQGDFDNRHVQLIDGKVVEMSPQKASHTVAVELVARVLQAAFGPGYWCRTQAPLHLSTMSAPEPDCAVVKGEPRDHLMAQPSTAELVVEVSDTTSRFDRGPKMRMYARAGITDYWVLDLKDRNLIVHRQPERISRTRTAYASIVALAADSTVSPLSLPNVTLRVADLLP